MNRITNRQRFEAALLAANPKADISCYVDNKNRLTDIYCSELTRGMEVGWILASTSKAALADEQAQAIETGIASTEKCIEFLKAVQAQGGGDQSELINDMADDMLILRSLLPTNQHD